MTDTPTDREALVKELRYILSWRVMDPENEPAISKAADLIEADGQRIAAIRSECDGAFGLSQGSRLAAHILNILDGKEA